MIAIVNEVFNRCGDYASCGLPGMKGYLVSHPDAIEDILYTHQDNYVFGEPDWSPYVRSIGRGLIYSDGDEYTRQRRLVQPSFHGDRLVSFCKVADASIAALLSRWQAHAGKIVDMHQEMMDLTLEIAGRFIFGDAILPRLKEFGGLSSRILLLATEMYLMPSGRFPWLPTRRQEEFRQMVSTMDALLYETIRRARDDSQPDGCVMAALHHHRNEGLTSKTDVEYPSDRLMRDLAAALLGAGHETTANMLTWTWHLLSENRDERDRLVQELQNTPNLDKPEAIQALPSLNLVLRESLRLCPPVWLIARRARKETNVAGYRISPGARLFISPYLVHHDSRWFDEPERFLPSRFADVDAAARHRFAYIPFGCGARRCVGQPFAETIGRLVIARLLPHFLPGTVEPKGVQPDPSFFRPKGGLRMVLHSSSCDR